MKHFVSILIGSCISLAMYGQICDNLGSIDYLHGNNIRTVTSTAGDMFWNRRDGQFLVPYSGINTPSTVFAAGLWIGGMDENAVLHLSANTYVYSNRYEFAPGPLVAGMTDTTACQLWDRHWNVFREDILKHLADYDDNGSIDKPVRNIFAWPGKSNPFFEEINGFPLPDDPELSAPFVDVDGDMIYDPSAGDYPHPENVSPDIVPSELQWCVFNDFSAYHNISGGISLRFEFQVTSFAFSCFENSLLNNTVFNSIKAVNRSNHTYDSLSLGIWMDQDIGCYTDDLMGCSPEHHSFFGYNRDAIDGGECFPLPTYGNSPPVQTTTFLNKPLNSFTYYNNAAWDNPFPGTIDPSTPQEFYNLLNSRFTDGTPITVGGSGYNTGSDTSKYVFPDIPTDTAGWSMLAAELGFQDRRIIGSVDLGTIIPSGSTTIDIAHSFHSDTSLGWLENINAIYPSLDSMLTQYDRGFKEVCAYPASPCDQDCVWPGDANRDGIVNAIDFMTVLTSPDNTGPKRLGPLAWQPLPATDWPETTFYGINSKHTDADGDGQISFRDLAAIELHYGLTNNDYRPAPEPRRGDNFTFSTDEIIADPDRVIPPLDFEITFTPQFAEPITGITFTLEVDPDYIDIRKLLSREYSSIFGDNPRYEMEFLSDSSLTVTDIMYERKSMPPPTRTVFSSRIIHERPDITNERDTTYIEITNAHAVLPSGKIISIPGQRLPVIFMEETPPTPSRLSATEAGDISFYPNPSSGTLNIDVPDRLIGSGYQVYDAAGRVVESGILNNYRTQLALTPGLHFIHVQLEDEVVVEKILVF